MTAITIIRQRHAVHVLTDGAVCTRDGTLRFIASKVWPVPHLNAVVAIRGPKLACPLVADAAGSIAQTYDELKSKIVDKIRPFYEHDWQWIMERCEEGPDFDLVVAGWSETSGPDSYFFCNHDQHRASCPSWTVVNLDGVSLLPNIPEFYDVFPRDTSPDNLDPEVDGMRMLELQRSIMHPRISGQEATALVGGFIQITTVIRDSITTKILHRWSDQIGEQLGVTR